MSLEAELEAIKARAKEIEEETERITQVSNESATVPLSLEEKQEIDSRSVYVGNVDYGATNEELESHFQDCGDMNRVTILRNKVDGHPKGFAYIEFVAKESVEAALDMSETVFRGRQIKVMIKRTNVPRLPTTNRFPRGGFRGRGAHMSRPFGNLSTRGSVSGYPGYRGRYAPY